MCVRSSISEKKNSPIPHLNWWFRLVPVTTWLQNHEAVDLLVKT